MRAAAFLCLFFAVLFQLLLNGQFFTNSLRGIALAVSSVALCLARARKARSIRETGWGTLVVLGLSVMLLTILLVQLPSAYTDQRKFNRGMELIRRRSEAKAAASELEADDDALSNEDHQ